jgi:hypothetical protein
MDGCSAAESASEFEGEGDKRGVEKKGVRCSSRSEKEMRNHPETFDTRTTRSPTRHMACDTKNEIATKLDRSVASRCTQSYNGI